MTQPLDYTALDKPVTISKGLINKIKFDELTLISLDDSNCYYKFSGYPVEIWVGLQEKKVPKHIFDELKTRDSLPIEFEADFNAFFTFLMEQGLVS